MSELFSNPTSVESSLLFIALVIAAGLALGSISFRGIRLGVAGILFSGLMFGHFGVSLNPTILSFTREFGLVLFVFAVGLSIGPGFFSALHSHGLRLNLLAMSVVLLGTLITTLWVVVAGISMPLAVGLFCGATTNTPSLAAATQALRDRSPSDDSARSALAQVIPDHPLVQSSGVLSEDDRKKLLAEVGKLPGMAYAVSYPGGVFGIIGAILLLRWAFRIDPKTEANELELQLHRNNSALEKMCIRVTNPNLAGVELVNVPAIDDLGVVISRVTRGTEEFVATPHVCLALGDVLLAVGSPDRLQQLLMIVGEHASANDSTIPSRIQTRWVTITRKEMIGRMMEELGLSERFSVQFTRIRRAGIELPPLHVKLSLGDEVHLVGLPENVAKAAHEFGDSPRKLGEPEMMPIFVAIALGVLVGSIPFTLPAMPGTVKLGLAGGPLVVAILLSRRQRIGPLVWYLPRSANLLLKDLGIALFLASVGLMSGDLFFDAFIHGAGLKWLGAGFVTTLAPLLIVGCVARIAAKQNFLVIVGMLAGSMTDPPALAFANSLANSEIPSVAYATVYPLTMILRIIAAQLLIMYWTG